MIDFIDVSIHFTGDDLFNKASFKINKDDKIALVGSNGSGKTTLLKMLAGKELPSEGNIQRQKNISVGYLPQEFINLSDNELLNEVKSSLVTYNAIIKKEEIITNNLNDPSLSDAEKDKLIISLGELNHKKEEIDFYAIDSRVEKVLIGLGFETQDFHRKTKEFSGGWQMRIELAKILLSDHDLIMLDEPTNHLDIESLRWLISFLKSYKGALLLVSHDRHFVNNVTNKTLEIFNKKITFFRGGYDDYLKFKEERNQQLIADYIAQEKKIKETQQFIERFRYKATKAKQVQSRIKQLEKIDQINLPDFESNIGIKFPEPPRSGAVPVEITGLTKAYDENLVFDKIDFKVERGDKFAFLGPNGAGKTTLAKIIANKLSYNSGQMDFGHNTSVSYYAQQVTEELDPELDLLDTLSSEGENFTPGQLRTILGSFLFSNDDVFKKVGVLSGGEKSRVALARLLLRPSNLIILDEPTNHLDHDSKKMLQNALSAFPGSLIIVSHDVDFIRPIANKVLEIKKGSLKQYHGGIDYYFQKMEEDQNTFTSQEESKVNSVPNKRDQKRLEAELRQKRYKATKDLRADLDKIESLIEKLELKKEQLEHDLSDPSIFSNPNLAKEKNSEYEKTKSSLDETFLTWTELTEKLEEIEASFN